MNLKLIFTTQLFYHLQKHFSFSKINLKEVKKKKEFLQASQSKYFIVY